MCLGYDIGQFAVDIGIMDKGCPYATLETSSGFSFSNVDTCYTFGSRIYVVCNVCGVGGLWGMDMYYWMWMYNREWQYWSCCWKS